LRVRPYEVPEVDPAPKLDSEGRRVIFCVTGFTVHHVHVITGNGRVHESSLNTTDRNKLQKWHTYPGRARAACSKQCSSSDVHRNIHQWIIFSFHLYLLTCNECVVSSQPQIWRQKNHNWLHYWFHCPPYNGAHESSLQTRDINLQKPCWEELGYLRLWQQVHLVYVV